MAQDNDLIEDTFCEGLARIDQLGPCRRSMPTTCE
jgi:hypothetical protein